MAFAIGMAAVLAGLGGFVYLRLGAELLRGIDMELQSRADVITTALARRGPLPLDARQGLLDPDEAFAQVLSPAGQIVDTSTAVDRGPMLPVGELRSVSVPTFLSRRVVGVDDPARVLAVPTRAAGAPLVVVVGATLGDRHEALDRLLLLLAIGGPAALALSSAAGWVLAGAALRPVELMRHQAAIISETDPNSRLPVPDTDDGLARLATTLNGLLGRLQEALEREHRFVDDASHELRTPLSILKTELDLAVARPRSHAELEETVHAAASETDRMVRLAEDLLVLARMRKGRVPLQRVDVCLRELLEQTAAPFSGRARAAGCRIEIVAPDETVRVDPSRIRQAVHNLLDNSLRHGGGSGPITISASRLADGVRIVVDDRGPGFSHAILGRAFDPFTRGPHPVEHDPGAGLGLAIVDAVAKAHGGSATARNWDGGARVELLLPADGEYQGEVC